MKCTEPLDVNVQAGVLTDSLPSGNHLNNMLVQISAHWGWAIFWAIIGPLIIRGILCIFKVWALKNGEAEETDKPPLKKQGFVKLFRGSFLSNYGDIRVDDYLLPFIIGSVELIFVPILLVLGLWKVIGGWIGFKALSSWGGGNKRTAYNRFVFGNILSLVASVLIYLFLYH